MEELRLLSNKINTYVKENWRRSMNEPAGILKYKFLDRKKTAFLPSVIVLPNDCFLIYFKN